MATLIFNKLTSAKMVCIQVAAGETVGNSNDPATVIINSLIALDNKPFPAQAGIWSGLLFSIKTSRSAEEKKQEQHVIKHLTMSAVNGTITKREC